MRARSVHQLVARLAPDDADSLAALDVQGRLWARGLRSELYAGDVAPELGAFARPFASLPRERREDEVVLARLADGVPLPEELRRLPTRAVRVPPQSSSLQAVRDAMRPLGLDLPEPFALRLVVLSSKESDGIRPYALALSAGLRANGHEVEYAGVGRASVADLHDAVRRVPRGADAVIVEHEFGLFRDVPFVLALARLRLRRVPVILSLHEVDPGKFHHYRIAVRALHYRQSYARALEAVRVVWVSLLFAWRFAKYRTVAWLMGALPQRLVIHSDRSRFWVDLLTSDRRKVDETPLLVRPLEIARLPRDRDEKRALRRRLGIPEDAFVFVSPGFFFKRKRFIEVLSVAPEDSVVILSGTRDVIEPEYFDEVTAFVRDRGLRNVIVNTDFATMGEHVAASDCVVLYYQEIFQSGIATQALWAGLPCIFSDLPGFHLYEGAGFFARTTRELRRAMEEIRRPEVYERLRRHAVLLQRLLAPERIAPRYLVGLGPGG